MMKVIFKQDSEIYSSRIFSGTQILILLSFNLISCSGGGGSSGSGSGGTQTSQNSLFETEIPIATPTPVPPTPVPPTSKPTSFMKNSLAGGTFHAVALKDNGSVWTWGDHSHKQLGYSATQPQTTPKVVPGLSNIKSVAASYYYTAALDSNGSAWFWGDQVMFPSKVDHPEFQNLMSIDLQIMNCGGYGARNKIYGIRTDHVLLSYDINTKMVAQIAGLPTTIKKLVIGRSSYNVALLNNSEPWAWPACPGDTYFTIENKALQLSVGASKIQNILEADAYFTGIVLQSPTQICLFRIISLAGNMICINTIDPQVKLRGYGEDLFGLNSLGQLRAWSKNISGQLGYSSAPSFTHTFPGAGVWINSIPQILSTSGGESFQLVETSDRRVWTWGQNSLAQLGLGYQTSIASGGYSATPTPIPGFYLNN